MSARAPLPPIPAGAVWLCPKCHQEMNSGITRLRIGVSYDPNIAKSASAHFHRERSVMTIQETAPLPHHLEDDTVATIAALTRRS